jgi:hypothetical protein
MKRHGNSAAVSSDLNQPENIAAPSLTFLAQKRLISASAFDIPFLRISGAVGGNVAGAAMKENSLGTAGNSIAGILGGGLGGTILHSVMGTAAAGWIFKAFLPTSVAVGLAARF